MIIKTRAYHQCYKCKAVLKPGDNINSELEISERGRPVHVYSCLVCGPDNSVKPEAPEMRLKDLSDPYMKRPY